MCLQCRGSLLQAHPNGGGTAIFACAPLLGRCRRRLPLHLQCRSHLLQVLPEGGGDGRFPCPPSSGETYDITAQGAQMGSIWGITAGVGYYGSNQQRKGSYWLLGKGDRVIWKNLPLCHCMAPDLCWTSHFGAIHSQGGQVDSIHRAAASSNSCCTFTPATSLGNIWSIVEGEYIAPVAPLMYATGPLTPLQPGT